MAHKRQATTNLNHENWDKEEEPEKPGTFQCATSEELSTRVIKKARRRGHIEEADSPNVFSNFTGFAPASSKPPNTAKLFSFLSKIPGAGEASVSSSTAEATKTTTQTADNKATFSFGSTFKNTNTTESSPKPPSFNIGNVATIKEASPAETNKLTTFNKGNDNANNAKKNEIVKSAQYCAKLRELNKALGEVIAKQLQVDSLVMFTNIFKEYENYLAEFDKMENVETSKSDSKTSTSLSSTSSTNQFKFGMASGTSTSIGKSPEPPKSNGSSLSFGLPSFGSQSKDDNTDKPSTNPLLSTNTKTTTESTSGTKPLFSFSTVESNSSDDKNKAPPQIGFGSSTFKFSSGTTSTPESNNKPGGSIFGPTATFNANKPATGFSFGIGTPLSFGNIQPPAAPAEGQQDEDDDDEPPKVEFKQVVEDDALYSKKCKVFVKKDNAYADRGVGTLYLKSVPNSTKAQLLVRADTNLGNILLNFILNEALPTQRTGKNNVMIVCNPTPDAEKPIPVLIRVKSGEDADELLAEIEKHKK